MAIYAFYDADMSSYFPMPPNLEIMKLANYYAFQKEVCILVREMRVDKYTKTFLRKDYDDGDFPSEIRDPRVVFGGYAFSGAQYSPLPMEIELTTPSTNWYSGLDKRIIKYSKYQQDAWKNYMEAIHMRLSLDGKNLWENFLSATDFYEREKSRKQRRIFFHDYDLGTIKNAREIVADLVKEKCFVGVKFPISVYSGSDLFRWRSLKWIKGEFKLAYYGMMSDSVFTDYIDDNYSVGHFDYYPTYGMRNQDEFMEALPKLFRQIHYAKRKGKVVFLNATPGVLEDWRMEKLLELLTYFSRAMRLPDYHQEKHFMKHLKVGSLSLLDFLGNLTEYPRRGQIFTKHEARIIMGYLKELDPGLVEWMYYLTGVRKEHTGLADGRGKGNKPLIRGAR